MAERVYRASDGTILATKAAVDRYEAELHLSKACAGLGFDLEARQITSENADLMIAAWKPFATRKPRGMRKNV